MALTKNQKLARDLMLLAQKFRNKNTSLQFELSHTQSKGNRNVTVNILTHLMPLKTMVKVYRYAFYHFKPNPKKSEILKLKGRGGFIEIVERKYLEESPVKAIKRFIAWDTLIDNLEEHLTMSLDFPLLDLCSLPLEQNQFDRIKKEWMQNSLTHQIQTIARYERQKPFIKAEYAKQKERMSENLLKKDALPTWEDSKKKFQKSPSEESNPDVDVEIAANPRNLDSVSFAPLEGESISIAYEKVMKSIHDRRDKHRFALRKIYKEELEKRIFEDVIIDKSFKKLPLIPLEKGFSKNPPKKPTIKLGRWETSHVIDYQTMNSILNYFYRTFIVDSKNTKAGDITVVILIRIWIASLGKSDCISTNDILNITSLDVNFLDKTLKVGKEVLPTPHWIFLLLRCYCSKKQQIRALRLFKSLDAHGKALERAFHEASNVLFGPEKAPILPEAMKYLPHGYLEGRIPILELNAMRKVEPLITS